MKRTAEQVVQEWRDSGSTDWGQLVSAINYWAMTDMCPELNAIVQQARSDLSEREYREARRELRERAEEEGRDGAAKGQEPR